MNVGQQQDIMKVNKMNDLGEVNLHFVKRHPDTIRLDFICENFKNVETRDILHASSGNLESFRNIIDELMEEK